MDVREAVKDKGKYKDIVGYFQGLGTLDTDCLALLIDTIERIPDRFSKKSAFICSPKGGEP